MQPCAELEQIVLQNYLKDGLEGGALDVFQGSYSSREGMLVIGTAPQDWYADREAIDHFFKASSGGSLQVQVEDIRAFCEGRVGWTADRVKLRLPDGNEIPIRHTKVFHREGETWKIVHLHVSAGVPDSKLKELKFPKTSGPMTDGIPAGLNTPSLLTDLIQTHYQKLSSGSTQDFSRSLFSRQSPPLVIGTEFGNWFEGYEAAIQFYYLEGAANLKVHVDDIRSQQEDHMGWVADRVTARLPSGLQVPVRHTYLFIQEGESWKLVHSHISVPVPDDKLEQLINQTPPN